jgi:hypothetical protein
MIYSAWHPLFTGSESYILKEDLEARGLEYLNTDYPTAALWRPPPRFMNILPMSG